MQNAPCSADLSKQDCGKSELKMIHLCSCRPMGNIAFLVSGDGAEMGGKINLRAGKPSNYFRREFGYHSSFSLKTFCFQASGVQV